MLPQCVVTWDEQGLEERVVANLVSLQEWEQRYAIAFGEDAKFGQNAYMKEMKVCHKEIDWKVLVGDIPLANCGADYNVGKVADVEIRMYLDQLEKLGVIVPMLPHEKYFFSPPMFFKKPGQIGLGIIRKIVDFRVLNSHVDVWKTQFLGTLSTLRRVPNEWWYFSVLDLSQGYFHVPVCSTLQDLFCFKTRGRRYKYQQLHLGRASSGSTFHSRMNSALEHTGAVVYVDYILISGESKIEHDHMLKRVLDQLATMGMHVNGKKVQFCKKKVLFLGYDVFQGGYSLDTYVGA